MGLGGCGGAWSRLGRFASPDTSSSSGRLNSRCFPLSAGLGSKVEGPAVETSDEDIGAGSARVGVELDGATDQRLEFRRERLISPGLLETMLLTRLLGLTSLRMLLRNDDRRDLGWVGESGTTSEEESGGRSVLAPATALGVAERVGRAGGSGESRYLELLWPIGGDTTELELFYGCDGFYEQLCTGVVGTAWVHCCRR